MSVLFGVLGFVVGFLISFIVFKKRIQSLSKEIEKEKMLELKESFEKERKEIEEELKKQRKDLLIQQEKITKRFEILDEKEKEIEKSMRELNAKEKSLLRKENELNSLKMELEKKREDYMKLLERVAGMNMEEARNSLLKEVEEKMKDKINEYIMKIEEDAKVKAEEKAKEIIATSIYRIAGDFVSEITTVQVSLPSEDMKGRIIGREGRNIRAFEAATGVEVIVDDTPGVITLSSFDGVRREIARVALEKLIADGRINPARIEEVVEKVKKEVEENIFKEGERVAYDMGIQKLHPELKKLIGRLKFRYSYGQNVLNHSIEVARVAGAIADELGVDSRIAKRAALLHDIGKGVDESVEGAHAEVGANIAKKYGESEVIVHAILSHHEDVPFKTVFDYIVSAADAISASRPGARFESVEKYIERIEKIEEIASSFHGVEKAFALSAGRELRVLVNHEAVSDEETGVLAREIARRIENEVSYPGVVKVVVIRELRKEEVAK